MWVIRVGADWFIPDNEAIEHSGDSDGDVRLSDELVGKPKGGFG